MYYPVLSLRKLQELPAGGTDMSKTKPFSISKDIVQLAYLRVKENRGSAGIDEMSLEKFENGRRENLYRLWNRMSSGSYMPLPVKLVEIPKQGGGIARWVSRSCFHTTCLHSSY